MSGNGALGPGEVVFFLHIPKTGGVTFSGTIDANFEPEEILPVPDPEDGLKMFRELSPARLASIRCARGHFWFGPGDRGVHDFLTPDPAIVTLLRNPIDRAVSVFQFVVANPEIWLAKRLMRPEASLSEFAEHPIEDGEIRHLRAMSLEDFVRDPLAQGELENLQARFVVGRVPGNAFSTTSGGYMPEQRLPDDELLRLAKTRLEEFAFVGLTERLDESVAMLARRFGWPMPAQIPRLNASPQPSRHYPASAAARKAILERAAVDVELHEHARGLFDARLAESRSSCRSSRPTATQESATMLAASNLPDDRSGQRVHLAGNGNPRTGEPIAREPEAVPEAQVASPVSGETLPLPPLEMREMVGPTDPAAFDNPSGALLFSDLPPQAYESVFDFGCGCGRLARQLIQQRQQPRRYLGVDLHLELIRWCQQNLTPRAPGFEFRHHDVAHPTRNPGTGKPPTGPLDAADRDSTLVLAHSVFTHLIPASAEHYLAEVARILAPKGVFVSTWFLFDKRLFPMMQGFQNALYINEVDPTNAVIFDREWLRGVASRNGLTICSATPPAVRGFQWSIYMTPARPGVAEVMLPPDEAPLCTGGTQAPPQEPTLP